MAYCNYICIQMHYYIVTFCYKPKIFRNTRFIAVFLFDLSTSIGFKLLEK